jgi:hypothetical protein
MAPSTSSTGMLTEPDLSDGDAKMTVESKYALLVQAPPCLRREGWIELDEMPVAASYVLDHITFASSAYLYDRATVEQLVGPHGLQPLMKLPLRFPRQYFVDKMMFTLRSCPDGWRSYEPAAAGQPAFGFYAKCWYNLMDLKPQGGTRLIIEHSPDWCARVYRCFLDLLGAYSLCAKHTYVPPFSHVLTESLGAASCVMASGGRHGTRGLAFSSYSTNECVGMRMVSVQSATA